MSSAVPLRVLHVTNIISPRYGGATTAILGICRGLVGAGVKTALLATDLDWPSGRLSAEQMRPSVSRGFVTRFSPAAWAPLGYAPSITRYLERFGYGFDLFHIHALYRYPHYAAASFARRAGIPYIISPHGSLSPALFNKPERRRMKRLYERIFELRNLRNAAAIHYTAEDEKTLVERLRLFRTPGFVTPLGFDLEAFGSLPARGEFRRKYKLGESPVVLFCGRIHPVKAFDVLLPAFAALRASVPEAKLVIVGPDNEGYWRECQQMAESLGIGANIILTGMLTGVEILQAYVDADVLALLSYTENFGNVVVEAMLCGTPVLISDRVNIWREIQECQAGMVVPCDIEAASKGLRSIMADKGERMRMGANGFAAARRLYAAPRVAIQLRGFYEQIIRDSKSRYQHRRRSVDM